MIAITSKLIISFTAQDTQLVSGSSYLEGRVEVFYNGSWGTVCDDDWDMTDANVFCRSMGFGDAQNTTSGSSYGQGSGIIAFDNVECNGTEPNIFDCQHKGYQVHDCDHSKDAGVTCSGNKPRLVMQLKLL